MTAALAPGDAGGISERQPLEVIGPAATSGEDSVPAEWGRQGIILVAGQKGISLMHGHEAGTLQWGLGYLHWWALHGSGGGG